jgi:alkylation response protein AidB-like acyl-CoA dehydrogenase
MVPGDRSPSDLMVASWADVTSAVAEIAGGWRSARSERQARRSLDGSDFARLADAGFLRVAVPEAHGGLWRNVAESTRPTCELLRMLARADSSVALVSSMHPAVVGFWLARPDPARTEWTAQRDAVFAAAAGGAQWGTITSEPGSGGDIFRTKAVARGDGRGRR